MGYYFFAILGLILERFKSLIIIFRCFRIENQNEKIIRVFLKSFLMALFYLDPAYMLFKHEDLKELSKKREI
jgi:hypothetical protein